MLSCLGREKQKFGQMSINAEALLGNVQGRASTFLGADFGIAQFRGVDVIFVFDLIVIIIIIVIVIIIIIVIIMVIVTSIFFVGVIVVIPMGSCIVICKRWKQLVSFFDKSFHCLVHRYQQFVHTHVSWNDGFEREEREREGEDKMKNESER